jgi:hypothetical protein
MLHGYTILLGAVLHPEGRPFKLDATHQSRIFTAGPYFSRLERLPVTQEVASSSLVGPAT